MGTSRVFFYLKWWKNYLNPVVKYTSLINPIGLQQHGHPSKQPELFLSFSSSSRPMMVGIPANYPPCAGVFVPATVGAGKAHFWPVELSFLGFFLEFLRWLFGSKLKIRGTKHSAGQSCISVDETFLVIV